VEVQRVDRIELGQVREVDPNRLRPADADRVLRVVEGGAVDAVEVVLAVAVGVEAGEDHHELLRRRPRLGRVDDERAVQPLGDVLLQRRRVAVVEVHPVGARRELVRERPARLDDLEDAVHVRRMDAVEVNRVRVRAAVCERDAQPVALRRADHRPRDGAIVRPGREEDSLGDLDLPVDRGERVLAHAAGPVRERRRRTKERVEVVGSAGRRDVASDHRRVRRGAHRVRAGRLCGRGLRDRHLRERRRCDGGGGRDEQLAARQTRFRHG
jgi:hypothetical protein